MGATTPEHLLEQHLNNARERVRVTTQQIEGTRHALLNLQKELDELVEQNKTARTEVASFQRVLEELRSRDLQRWRIGG